MSDSIYLLQAGDELVELHEEGYLLEDHLQRLLAQHPVLLSGELMNPDSPRKWLLIRREAGLSDTEGGGDRWSLDHLFIAEHLNAILTSGLRRPRFCAKGGA